MKNIITILLLIVIVFGAYFFGNKNGSSRNITCSSTPLLLNDVKEMINYNVDSYINHFKSKVNNLADIIRNEREFILSVVVDNDLTSPTVTSIAKKYGELLDFDGVKLTVDNTSISSFGEIIDIEPHDSITIFPKGDTISIVKSKEFTIRNQNFRLTCFNYITTEQLKKLPFYTLVMDKNNILLSTINSDKINRVDSNTYIYDTDTLLSIETELNDSLKFVNLFNIRKVNK